MKTPWEKKKEKANAPLGFITRLNAFRDPTPGEIARAIAVETDSWQKTKGTRPYLVSAEYKTPLGHGINLKRTREPGGRLDGPEYDKAIYSYVDTPMDHYDILKEQGIDVSKYENPYNFFQKSFFKIKDWYKSKIDPDYEPPIRLRLTKDFIKTFGIKEKK